MKVLTPIMAKISQNMRQTKSTVNEKDDKTRIRDKYLRNLISPLKIDGNAPTRALTTTFIPSILAMALRGLKALRVLMVLKMGMLPAPNKLAPKLISDTATIERKNFKFGGNFDS